MRRLSGYPAWFYGLTIGILLSLLASALLLVPNTAEMRLDMDVPVHIGGNLRLGAAAAHSFLGFLSLVLLGSLIALHMRLGWQRGLNCFSGIALVVAFALLLLSAIGIYYFGNPDLSRYASLSHTLIGFVLAALFIWHSVQGRRIRRSNRSSE